MLCSIMSSLLSNCCTRPCYCSFCCPCNTSTVLQVLCHAAVDGTMLLVWYFVLPIQTLTMALLLSCPQLAPGDNASPAQTLSALALTCWPASQGVIVALEVLALISRKLSLSACISRLCCIQVRTDRCTEGKGVPVHGQACWTSKLYVREAPHPATTD